MLWTPFIPQGMVGDQIKNEMDNTIDACAENIRDLI